MAEDGSALTREQVEAAIAAQEGLRATLGDAIVDATIAALRAQLPPDDAVAHHRKLVTVLFTDVVGSTDLMRGRDPEETMAVMDSALARLAGPIAAHGGRVTRFMGDGFMAVFGLPTAHENDPEMAVRSGLKLVEESHHVARDLEREHGLAGFAIRVGINTGLVVTGGVTEAADTIMGDAVNLASRLESAAPPGAVLISHDTQRHVRGRFHLEDGGLVDAKGFTEPVRTYRVIGQPAATLHRATRGIEGLEIPMVGREDELVSLLEAAAEVASSRQVQAVTVEGEAGLGKSRLLDEFRARLDSEVVQLDARATLESGDLPYALVKNLIERRYAIASDLTAAAARKQLVTGIAAELDEPGAAARAPFVGQLIGYDFRESPEVAAALDAPHQIRSRAVLCLTDLLAALARSSPVLLAIEDLHWADADSLGLLDAVLEGLDARPVLLVASARPLLGARDEGWLARPFHRWQRLEPLSPGQAEALVDTTLRKIVDCPDTLRRRLVEQASGNPYYLEETVRMLVDDRVIVTGPDAWTVDLARLQDLRIPDTITGVIQARLDALPGPQRAVLQQASVVGRVFWDTIVAHLATVESRSPDVTAALGALDQREMIHRRATSLIADATEYAFHHEIQRSVAYEGVLRSVRRTYHSIVADWLIATQGDRGTELSGLIAGHLERAGREPEALDCFADAAAAAVSSYAVEAADGFFERALALVPEADHDRRYTLLLGREKTLGMRGLHDQQRGTLDDLAALAGDDPVRVATVHLRRVWSSYFAGQYRQAVDAARTAVASAARTDDLALQARTRSALGTALFAAGDRDAARPEAEQALAQAVGAADDEAQHSARTSLGLILLAGSELSLAREHLMAAIRLAQQRGDLERETVGVINLGVVETRLGNYASARSAFERVRTIAAEVGDRQTEAIVMINIAWVAASEGDWSTAVEIGEAGIERHRAIGHPDAVAEGLMWLGQARLGLGQPEAARAAFSEALAIREDLGQAVLALEARAGVASAALAGDDVAGALAETRAITDHLASGGTLAGAWEPLRVHLTCAKVLQAAGDAGADAALAAARRLLLDQSARITDPADQRMFLEQVPWHREILALTGGADPR